MLPIIKECLAKYGIVKIDFHSTDEGTVLESSREGLSLRITLREGMITREDSQFFHGQPKVMIKTVASSSSDDDKKLQETINEFRYCVLIRAARGGG
jgi:hypothetical protein